jgi:hypothetical protein
MRRAIRGKILPYRTDWGMWVTVHSHLVALAYQSNNPPHEGFGLQTDNVTDHTKRLDAVRAILK